LGKEEFKTNDYLYSLEQLVLEEHMDLEDGGGVVFIANEDIYTRFLELIKNAKHDIVFVTPWFHPTGHLKQNLIDALHDDVRLGLFTRPIEKIRKNDSPSSERSKKTHKREIEALEKLSKNLTKERGRLKLKPGLLDRVFGAREEEVNRAEIVFIPDLHAKIIIADDKAVISSSNIIYGSLTKNIEAGIFVNRASDLIDEIMDFIDYLYGKYGDFSDQEVSQNSKGVGHCIRCGKSVSHNLKAPLCGNCYTEWAKWKRADYGEKYCHTCGMEYSNISKNKPQCLSCYKK
jgi:phosphatidylserine/phosphatidylglycerophosphate/cardiolipin synthase-like enzyme